MNATGLTRTRVEPVDFLFAAADIHPNNASTCSLNHEWIEPATYLEWARRGLAEADEYGITNALTYAKRAAGCRIDRLIRNYHLQRFLRCQYPTKISDLSEIGINVPTVIQELIIDPRNQLEHEYTHVDARTAKRAIDVASLFLSATDADDQYESIVALNMNALVGYSYGGGSRKVTFNGWHGGPMLFINIFSEPHTAKIVNGVQGEVVFAELNSFSRRQAVQLASILHSHFSMKNRGSSGSDSWFFTELQRLAGF